MVSHRLSVVQIGEGNTRTSQEVNLGTYCIGDALSTRKLKFNSQRSPRP